MLRRVHVHVFFRAANFPVAGGNAEFVDKNEAMSNTHRRANGDRFYVRLVRASMAHLQQDAHTYSIVCFGARPGASVARPGAPAVCLSTSSARPGASAPQPLFIGVVVVAGVVAIVVVTVLLPFRLLPLLLLPLPTNSNCPPAKGKMSAPTET